MTPRITAARLAEISEKLSQPVKVGSHGWAEELLNELREVTRERDAYKRAKEENDERFMRERDEARAERDEARADYRDHDEYLHNCHKLLKEAGHHVAQGAIDGIHSLINERDKLKQERDEWKSAFAAFKPDALAEIQRLIAERDKAVDAFNFANEHRVKAEMELADLDAEAGNEYAIVMHYKGEMERLAAKVESLEEFYDTHVGDALEADDLRVENAKLKAVADAARPTCERYRQFDKTVKPEIEVLEATLAALDGRDEKGKGV